MPVNQCWGVKSGCILWFCQRKTSLCFAALSYIHWIQTRTVDSHPLYFNLTEPSSLLAPPVLSTRLHLPPLSSPSTSYQSSFYLWPFTRCHQLPAAQTASHPAFNTIMFFCVSPKPLAPLSPSPCLNLPPQSAYLCLKPSYPLSRSPILPVISLPLYPAQENRRHYLLNCTNDTCPSLIFVGPYCIEK